MRHGRWTKSKRFNGNKRHLAIDLDTVLVLAVTVRPANRSEQEAAPSLVADITAQGLTITSLYIDRGYINAPVVDEILSRRGGVICRPWLAHNGSHFGKRVFKLGMRDRTITCPAGEQQPIVLGAKVEFPAETCRVCPRRAKCTMPLPTAVAPSRSPTTNFSSIGYASRLRGPQTDQGPTGAARARARRASPSTHVPAPRVTRPLPRQPQERIRSATSQSHQQFRSHSAAARGISRCHHDHGQSRMIALVTNRSVL